LGFRCASASGTRETATAALRALVQLAAVGALIALVFALPGRLRLRWTHGPHGSA
jgi:hypothetical protein